ncbi:MAG: hydrogenase formation protein HypD [Candidatus Lokiarchaeota archaeon]|nr:hydrogenase formation protein HypD [Candidatus Lokiarchaeota archaeon]
MKNKEFIKSLLDYISGNSKDQPIKITHVCGTHEQVINSSGIRSMLPKNIELIAGPGCPVCVCPSNDIDEAIYLARKGITVATFGDMVRVPSTESSLIKEKSKGYDVRTVYGPIEAVQIAKENPDKEVVFFAVGFETTAPSVAREIIFDPPENFSILCSLRTIPPVMELLLGLGDLEIDGFICPGHVAVIIGLKPFDQFSRAYGMPNIITGFEPTDILMAIALFIRQLKTKNFHGENEYKRAVKQSGNVKAQEMLEKAFNIETVHWRGIGRIPSGGFRIKEDYSMFNARKKFDINIEKSVDIRPGCCCHLIMTGRLAPTECKLFKKVCTPEHPYGPCMVSNEGTCHIWFKYGKHFDF